MSDPEPIDLSQLKNLNLAPDWVGDLQKRESAPGEVIWGRAPEHERESRGGGQGQGFGSGSANARGPRREGGGFGARPDFNRPGGPSRGPRADGSRGSGPENRGPRPSGPPRGDTPRGPRSGGPPPGDRGPRPGPGGPPRDDRRSGPDRRDGGSGRPDFRNQRQERGRFDDRPYIEPLPGWRARLFAEPRSLEAITRQVKASGRAYPVFELGRLFLAGRDRYVVEFSRQPQPQAPRNMPKGTPVPTPEPLRGPEQIYHIPSDGSVWLNRDEAIRHLINGPSMKKFYRREIIKVDPPKGIFTAVAVCGFSGEILGPPNHHSFQTTVARLHREQFYNLPLDRYKARIRTEKDEALVAKWLEEQSSTTVYIPLTALEIIANDTVEATANAAREIKPNTEIVAVPVEEVSSPTGVETPVMTTEGTDEILTTSAASTETDPTAENDDISVNTALLAENTESVLNAEVVSSAEPNVEGDLSSVAAVASNADPEPAPADPLKTWAAVEAHFLAHHADQAVRAVTHLKVPGNIPGKLLAPPLLALLRVEVEQQQRFPMQLVQDLCRDLEKENLKFFKRDKKATFVSRTRPHFIDDESHLSPRLRSIVGVVRANPGITVSKLVSTLAPHIEKPASKLEVILPTPAPVVPEATAEELAAPVLAPAHEAIIHEVSPADPAELAVSVAEVPAAETARPETPETSKPTGEEKLAGAPRERTPKNQRNPQSASAPESPPAPLTMEEIGVLQDLRWLVGEGLVTEFASGELQILGRLPQPPAEKKSRPDLKAEVSRVAVSPILAISPTENASPDVTANDIFSTDILAAESILESEGDPQPNEAIPEGTPLSPSE